MFTGYALVKIFFPVNYFEYLKKTKYYKNDFNMNCYNIIYLQSSILPCGMDCNKISIQIYPSKISTNQLIWCIFSQVCQWWSGVSCGSQSEPSNFHQHDVHFTSDRHSAGSKYEWMWCKGSQNKERKVSTILFYFYQVFKESVPYLKYAMLFLYEHGRSQVKILWIQILIKFCTKGMVRGGSRDTPEQFVILISVGAMCFIFLERLSESEVKVFFCAKIILYMYLKVLKRNLKKNYVDAMAYKRKGSYTPNKG